MLTKQRLVNSPLICTEGFICHVQTVYYWLNIHWKLAALHKRSPEVFSVVQQIYPKHLALAVNQLHYFVFKRHIKTWSVNTWGKAPLNFIHLTSEIICTGSPINYCFKNTSEIQCCSKEQRCCYFCNCLQWEWNNYNKSSGPCNPSIMNGSSDIKCDMRKISYVSGSPGKTLCSCHVPEFNLQISTVSNCIYISKL